LLSPRSTACWSLAGRNTFASHEQWARGADFARLLIRATKRFTVAPENIGHTEGIGEFVAAPIDIPQLVTMVSKLVSQKISPFKPE
jgi:hypothetical protein